MGASVLRCETTPPAAPLPPQAPNAPMQDDGANDHDPFADYRRRGGMRCPHCRNIANRRTSVEVTPVFWDIYYVCSHPGCGFTWKASLSFVHGLSPSAIPNPELDLPMRTMTRGDVIKPEPPPSDDPRQPRFFD